MLPYAGHTHLPTTCATNHHMHAVVWPQGERVRQIMAEAQPAPIRIKLITQLQGTYLKPEQAKRLAEQLAPGAVRIIQKFVQVWGPDEFVALVSR